MKIFYFDTETTGLTHQATVVQIAGIIEIDGVVKEEVNLRCAPFADSEISEEALQITGLTREEIASYPDPRQVCKELTTILGKYVNRFDKTDKFTVVGHNVRFDIDKIRTWAFRCQERFLGSYLDFASEFDTLALVKCLKVYGRLEATSNNKLTTLCEAYGIPLENAHDAMADIQATKALFEYLRNK